MTCEVAVMNRRGVALAADSAVTLGDGLKVYHTAEKLFQLSSFAPVGVMSYGTADIMEVPWETVIKLYSQKLGDRRFDRLEQYGQDFLRFIEGSEALFPESAQRRSFRQAISAYWEGVFLRPLKDRLEKALRAANKHVNEILMDLIGKDFEADWKDSKALDDLGDGYGDRVMAEYGPILDELEHELFGAFKLSREVREALRTAARFMYTQKVFAPDAWSGIVIAGIGESEALPVLMHYHVGTVAAGKLRFLKVDEAQVGHEVDGIVIPLAQRDVIDMFYGGISPQLREKLVDIAGRALFTDEAAKNKPTFSAAHAQLKKHFDDNLKREMQQSHTDPLTLAVAGLPRHELAGLAEALVSITAFMARMSADQKETVGGPIDVALISKGDGFVWVKRKDPVRGSRFL
jgi:hypothetical protein